MNVEVYRKNVFWRVKIVGGNGEDLLVSETYYSKSNATRAALKLRAAIGGKPKKGKK